MQGKQKAEKPTEARALERNLRTCPTFEATTQAPQAGGTTPEHPRVGHLDRRGSKCKQTAARAIFLPPSKDQDTQRRADPPLHPEEERSITQPPHQQQRAQEPPPPSSQAEWNGHTLPHDSVWSDGGLLPHSNGAPPPPFPLPQQLQAPGNPLRTTGNAPIYPLEQLLRVALHQIDHLLRTLGPTLAKYAHLQSHLPADSP